MPGFVASNRLPVLVLLCLSLGVPPAAWLAGRWAEGTAREALAATGRAQLALYGANLMAELERHRPLPMVLAKDSEVVAFLRRPAGAERLNRRLEGLSDAAGALAVYLLDRAGTTVAASNWNQETSFLGQNYAWRPYFQDAVRRGIGRNFALGTASGVPGYYIGFPVRDGDAVSGTVDDPVLGVVVVKVGLDAVERNWTRSAEEHDGERVIVTDPHGIIAITNAPAWRFHSLKPLSPEERAAVADSLQYAGTRIPPLPTVSGRRGEGNDTLVVRDADTGGRSTRYLVQSTTLSGTDWTLSLLMPMEPVLRQMASAALNAGLATVVVVLAAAYGLYRRLALGERLERQRRTRADLERRVAERTADLLASNQRLVAEIRERERAEDAVRTAQDELVQAAKLAALGQMAAGVVHEVNQPLAAIRAYADNAVVLLDRGKAEPARANLVEIAGLTERMASISRQLKQFARKSSGLLEPVCVVTAIDQSLALVEARRRAERVTLSWEPPAALVQVRGEDVRLQQVLVNLFRNALDALRDAERRVLSVRLDPDDAEGVRVEVRDTGPGIDAGHRPHLFEPFFTTKPVGEGLGLGLSISYRIVREFGGQIRADNHPDGGAVFTLILPRPEPR